MALTFDRDQNDTIAAIATGMSEAGIGIVRISGPHAADIIRRIYRTKSGKKMTSWKPNTIHYGKITDPETGEVLDEVLVSWMEAPHSYTTEDTAEINTHGGTYVIRRVLDAVLRAGARMAEPGEFTKRAFLGGRMDLSEAGAVMDLIRSQNEFARKVSLAQLEGSVSGKVKELRSSILYEIAYIESALDDPENYSLDGYPDRLQKKCEAILSELEAVLRRSENGKVLQEGIRTVIIGKPNAGKSSLLNRLAGEERAIVTSVAGTTRDTLEETVRLGDLTLRVTDTAGIHETEDPVEKIGVERARKAMETAQLFLFVLDTSAGITEEDRQIAQMIEEELTTGRHCIVLLNKSDLPTKIEETEVRKLWKTPNMECLSLSALENTGLDELRGKIEELFHLGEIASSTELFVTDEFQKSALRETIRSLQLVIQSIESGMSEDFFSIDLRNAYASLGRMIGEEVEDDLVEEIFSRFCLGK